MPQELPTGFIFKSFFFSSSGNHAHFLLMIMAQMQVVDRCQGEKCWSISRLQRQKLEVRGVITKVTAWSESIHSRIQSIDHVSSCSAFSVLCPKLQPVADIITLFAFLCMLLSSIMAQPPSLLFLSLYSLFSVSPHKRWKTRPFCVSCMIKLWSERI